MVLVKCFVVFSVLLPKRVRSASVGRRSQCKQNEEGLDNKLLGQCGSS